MAYAALICRTVVGLVFAVSAFSKLRNGTAYREFASWLASVPVPLVRNRALPPVLAGAEAAIVVLVAVPATAVAGLMLATFVVFLDDVVFLVGGDRGDRARGAGLS